MRIEITALTHRGLVRDHNEDCLGWAGWALQGAEPAPMSVEVSITTPFAVVVCDGMGGQAAGEVASRMAVESLTAPVRFADCTTVEACRSSLRTAIQDTSDAINNDSERHPWRAGMGCTAVGAIVLPDGGVSVFNVGDSRCYRTEDEFLAQLTEDDRSDSRRSSLAQALGGGRRTKLAPHFFDCSLPATTPGLILTTDGVDDYAALSAIERAVLAHPVVDLPSRLRDVAFAGGGGDNVTIVHIRRIDTQQAR